MQIPYVINAVFNCFNHDSLLQSIRSVQKSVELKRISQPPVVV